MRLFGLCLCNNHKWKQIFALQNVLGRDFLLGDHFVPDETSMHLRLTADNTHGSGFDNAPQVR